MYEIENGALAAAIEENTPRRFGDDEIRELFMLLAGKVTELALNDPGTSFIIVTDKDEEWVEMDGFEFTDYIDAEPASVKLYPEYLEMFREYSEYLTLEFQQYRDDELLEWRATFNLDPELLQQLMTLETVGALEASLNWSSGGSETEFMEEVTGFCYAALKL